MVPEQHGPAVTAKTAAPPGELLLELRQIAKSYGPTRALAGVDFDLRRGEVHALLGQNGSGKSTLMKVAYGEVQPDDGEILVAGEPQRFKAPRDALRNGIIAVAQEIPLALDLSVTENILLGQLPRRGSMVNWRAARDRAATILARLNSTIDPSATARSLPPHDRQTIAIAHALGKGMRIMIFDEPTSSLSVAQAERLFDVMRRLKAQGIAMVFITQRLKEIGQIADRVTVVRDGRRVAAFDMHQALPRGLAEIVTGRALETTDSPPRAARSAALLQVRGLTHEPVFRDISFDVAAGEIVGISGLIGCGRTELLRALFGASHAPTGEVRLDGKAVSAVSPDKAVGLGIAMVTGDRRNEGLVLTRSVQENLMMARRRRLSLSKIDFKSDRKLASAVVQELRINTPSLGIPVGSLSGGNQQKVVLGKWLAMRPRVLILDEPTRGIDVAAKADFYRAVGRLAESGLAVIVGSLDDQELIEVCHRIVVMHEGRLVADLDAGHVSEDELLLHASGLGARV